MLVERKSFSRGVGMALDFQFLVDTRRFWLKHASKYVR